MSPIAHNESRTCRLATSEEFLLSPKHNMLAQATGPTNQRAKRPTDRHWLLEYYTSHLQIIPFK